MQFAYDNSVKVGYVISTNPASGSDVVKGQQITVTVSQGPETKTGTVPNVVKMTQADAQAAIIAARVQGWVPSPRAPAMR